MEFQFDVSKSHANQLKHGINFVEAQILWNDTNRQEVPTRTVNETRWLVIGLINRAHYSAVVTYREDQIRLISVRRACKEEVRIYES